MKATCYVGILFDNMTVLLIRRRFSLVEILVEIQIDMSINNKQLTY